MTHQTSGNQAVQWVLLYWRAWFLQYAIPFSNGEFLSTLKSNLYCIPLFPQLLEWNPGNRFSLSLQFNKYRFVKHLSRILKDKSETLCKGIQSSPKMNHIYFLFSCFASWTIRRRKPDVDTHTHTPSNINIQYLVWDRAFWIALRSGSRWAGFLRKSLIVSANQFLSTEDDERWSPGLEVTESF